MAAGSLTLGVSASLAAGPLGRNGEAAGSLNTSGTLAAMSVLCFRQIQHHTEGIYAFRYSYSKTKGLFGGLSIEGSVLVERQDANAQAYHSDVSAKQLLSGSIDRPEWASSLINTLEECTSLPGKRKWAQDGMAQSGYAFHGAGSSRDDVSSKRKTKEGRLTFPPTSWGRATSSGSYFESESQTCPPNTLPSTTLEQSIGFETHFDSDFVSEDQTLQLSQPGSAGDSFDTAPPYVAYPTASSRSSNHNLPLSSTSPFTSSSKSHAKSFSYSPSSNPFSAGPKSFVTMEPKDTTRSDGSVPAAEMAVPLLSQEGVDRSVALYDYRAVEVSIKLWSSDAL
jgi:hypothetical protein